MIILPIRRNGHNIGEFHLHEITRLLSKKTLRPTDEVLMACIDKRFARKGEKVVEANRQAFAAGRDAVAKQMAAAPA